MQFIKGTIEQLKELLKSPELVIDLETTGLNPRKDTVLELAIAIPGLDVGYVFPANACELLATYNGLFIGHNIIDFDQAFLIPYGVRMYPFRVFDTMLVHHLYNENISHKLDSIVKEHFQDPYKEVFWTKYQQYQDAPEEEKIEYAAKDVVYTGRLYNLLRSFIVTGEIAASLVKHTHHLAFALAATSRRGIKIDTEHLTNLGVRLKSRLDVLDSLMRNSAELDIKAVEYDLWLKALEKRKTIKGKANVQRPVFNFDSPKQLVSLLYDKLNLPKQFKKKAVTTDYDALQEIRDLHPIVDLLQEQREKSKLYGTYVEGLFPLIENGRVYPEFHVNGTVTGRISHSNPNMGNVPKQGGYRGVWVPDTGMCLISADFGQLEVCIAAHITQDPALLSIILEGRSQHDITAAGLGIKRDLAKTINFGMQYGASHFKVAKVLDVSVSKGKEAYEQYWKTYAGLKREMDICAKCVDEGIPIVTLTGRKRRFEVTERQPWDSAYRQAWNAKVQGTGADMTSIAFYRVHEELEHRGWGYGLFTVHDEILISVKTEYAAEAEQLLCDTMLNIGTELKLSVPLKVESSGPMQKWED